MNTKAKKGIFWGVMVASTVLVINVLHFLLGGSSAYARGPQGDMVLVEWDSTEDLAGASR